MFSKLCLVYESGCALPSQKSRLYLKHIWPNIFDQICLDERPKHISLNRFRVKHNSKHISIKTCLNSNIFQICFKPNLFAEIGLKHKISNLFRNISRSDIRNIFQICFNRTFQTHFKTSFFWLGILWKFQTGLQEIQTLDFGGDRIAFGLLSRSFPNRCFTWDSSGRNSAKNER